MEDAIAYAVKKADLGSDYIIMELPEQKDFLSRLMESVNEEEKFEIALKQRLGVYYDYLKGLEYLQSNTGIQARMPFDMIIE